MKYGFNDRSNSMMLNRKETLRETCKVEKLKKKSKWHNTGRRDDIEGRDIKLEECRQKIIEETSNQVMGYIQTADTTETNELLKAATYVTCLTLQKKNQARGHKQEPQLRRLQNEKI